MTLLHLGGDCGLEARGFLQQEVLEVQLEAEGLKPCRASDAAGVPRSAVAARDQNPPKSRVSPQQVLGKHSWH